ncbi:four helix bundle protein [Dyadobacter sp. CY323]|uniref:four helix bundle protein n=1 Tax=Dyadobacter sp. CY323 TaxID=2907302 RepID=UPI001F21FAD0|nr:four helix bundle protein [Dyadobacter sp. CY323]MCE6992676.1 four helix bundle protein [Dyadobacter sp. CY323]
MSKVEKFEDLKVWQDGLSLSILVYEMLHDCKDFGLRDQMCRASVSVPSNIAEGFERHSNKEFIRFLRIAKGSSGELRTQIFIAIGIGLITSEKGNDLISKSQILSAMIQNLIKTRESNF